MFKINDKEVVEEIKRLKKSIPKAADLARLAIANKAAEHTKELIKKKIPGKGGWYDIYRDSLVITRPGPKTVRVTVDFSEIKLGSIPADTSLIWISSKDDQAATVLSHHNPWTLDTIPAIKDGINCELIVKPSSESESNFHRKKRHSEMTSIHKQLVTVGATVEKSDGALPKINGRILADVPFLVQRLEHGLGGFPRTPIWSRLEQQKDKILQSKDIQEAGRSVFAKKWRSKK
jgi:hypothetical protein